MLLHVELEQLAEFFDLARREGAIAAGRDIEFEETDLHAAQFLHQTSKMFEHHADLILAAFLEFHFVPRIVARLDQLDQRGRGLLAADRDAGCELCELFFGEVAVDLHHVGLLDVAGGGSDAMRELAVIGEQQQAFAGVVETANREDAFLHATQQMHDGLAAFGVGDGGDHFARLVQRDVDQLLGSLQQLAVHFDVVAGQVGFGAELGEDLPVDADASGLDQFFGFAAAGDTSLRQDFLEAFFRHVRTSFLRPVQPEILRGCVLE